MLKKIELFVESFFEKLNIKITSLEVILEDEDTFFIKVESPDSGIIIGKHGIIFEAIQSILRSIFFNKYDKKIKLHLEINDYIYNRDSRLLAFIDSEIEKAKITGRNMKLPVLNGYERKKVHLYIHKLGDDLIKSESRGEGKNRRMFILFLGKKINKISEKKSKKLEIDIDGDDI